MQLPEIDGLGAEPAKGRLERAQQVLARSVHPSIRTIDRTRLGGDDHLIANLELLDELAQQGLCIPVGVDIGRVEQRAARIEEGRELIAGLVLVGSTCPGARAEAEPAHPQAGSAEGSQLHDGTLPP